ncbi:MAG: phenylalanine--tRNA ligase subunit beta [Bacteroidales bacterium]|nr:phenylalanine--tRNA ligase subunit beta [Bacteroidales bacterium]
MNISYSWLKDYINCTLSPEDLAAALTSTGLECDGVETVESIRGGLRGLVVGKVLTCTEHPDSDHLHVTMVDLGGGHVEQIVCGAPNVAAGQTVIVATVGTVLYDGDKEFKIKKSKIRGVESMGMICAEDEIGVGNSHDGIIVIEDEVAPGTPAAEYYNLTDDHVLEVDLTPNRIDAASHFGVARDVAAWMTVHGQTPVLSRPDISAFHVDDPGRAGVGVDVVDAQGCVRYSGVTIEGVKVAESPEWLRNRLNAIGVRPINNIVDITNYVLHAVGQPLHCFDRAHIAGDKVVVRTVDRDTPFVTLDGVERKLDAADLMICDANRPMCIAGVFGGLDSGVTEECTSVFLESACFNATRVRKTARRHGLNTDASFRFERGVDPNGTIDALKLAALMVNEIAGGKIVGDVVDIYPAVVERPRVELSTAYMDALIGKHIPDDTVDAILEALEVETESNAAGVRTLRIPTYRVDVTRPCDVVEDILRIYGYNNVEMPAALHASLSFKTPTDAADDLRRCLSGQLTAQGFNEILNNSLTAEAYYEPLSEYPAEHCVRLLNPLSQDLNVMRQTLLFGGLENLAHNINRKNKDLAFYEFGNVYFRNPQAESTAERPLAPYSEGARLALWLTGDIRHANWAHAAEPATFFHLKAYVANILARAGVSERETVTAYTTTELLSDALTISTRSGKRIGIMGIVDKAVARRCEVKQPVYFAEIDFDALSALALKRSVTFAELPKTQPVKRDLALLVDKSVTMADIENAVRDAERRLLRSVELFDVYEGDKLPAGKKSYAITMTIQDNEKTLNDKAIDAVMKKITANLGKKVGAELR